MEKRKVILVDSNSFLRKALKNTLQTIGNVEVVAEASCGTEFLNLLDKLSPDIVFMDIKIPHIDGIEATRIASKKSPNTVIIGFSVNERKCYIDQMIQAGAKGYLSKCKNNIDILAEIIKNPHKGHFYSIDNNSF